MTASRTSLELRSRHAEDVFEAALLQGGDGIGADHPTIGDDADVADCETAAQAVEMTGTRVVTSAWLLPGHISEQTGRPCWSTMTPTIIWFRCGR